MAALVEGQRITHRAGPVLIILLCVRPGAYRVSVCRGSTGAEIPQLSASYPTEAQARQIAREHARRFTAGGTVDQVLATAP